tara:strand:+ start:1979 stop:3100 length:1122 start_codon:yes stop_codon:yes gene_type:complete
MKVGVLGGGQLAKMMAVSAGALGIEVVCIDPSKDACAADVTKVVCADFHDRLTIDEHFNGVDYITYETENLPATDIEALAASYSLAPSFEALKLTQDRHLEKQFLSELAIEIAPYRAISKWDDLLAAIETLQFPLVLKTRCSGYDGKGQRVVRNQQEAERAWADLGAHPLIVEKVILFDKEVSLISVRSKSGEIRFYPLVLNDHREGILRVSQAPFCDPALQKKAEKYAAMMMEKLGYVGVMTIEFFVVDDCLLVNELAPRVHNSGHWTIEGAQTSQFENHLRAICGLPLGSTAAKYVCSMINIIGKSIDADKLRAIGGLHYHWYGKTVRHNRKLGHVTICADNADSQSVKLRAALDILGQGDLQLSGNQQES